MPLTVKDILEKTFKRSFKGYDEDEVDRFLDQVIDEFKALQAENESLKATLAETSERLARVSETEATIMNTLVSAQKSSERLLAEAARKAELIIDSAQTTAARRAEQTKAELVLAEKRLEEIKGQATVFAESFANLVNSQAASFQQAYREYFGEPEAPRGINTEATRRISADVESGLKDIGESVGNGLRTQNGHDRSDRQNRSSAVPEDEPAATQPDEAEADTYGLEPEPEVFTEPDVPAGIAIEEPAAPVPIAEAGFSEKYEPVEETPSVVYEEPVQAAPPAYEKPVEAAPPVAFEEPEEPLEGKGVLSLQEINRALRELEEQDGSILGDDGDGEGDSRPRYDDYSWLYDSDSTEPAQEIAGKDDPELKSLIDEVID